MISRKIYAKLLSRRPLENFQPFNGFHICSFQLNQNSNSYGEQSQTNNLSSLWFTTLPKITRNRMGRPRKQKPLPIIQPVASGPPLIECKRSELNHYSGTHYKKFQQIPLACKGWKHSKSRDDYFIIHPSAANPAFLLPQSDKDIPDEFEDLGINEELVKQLHVSGFLYPTTIQLMSIPRIIGGENVLITADTGCGKTLAYVIPMIEFILRYRSKIPLDLNAPVGIVILPTRELVIQVQNVIQNLCEKLDIRVKILLSNRTRNFLLNLSEKDFEEVDILIGTIGTLCKLSHHSVVNLNRLRMLVVDEADTLLDDSFSDKLKVFMKRCRFRFNPVEATSEEPPEGVQLALVSATAPRDITNILGETYPAHMLQVIRTNYLHKIQPHICQKFIRSRKSDKEYILLKLVRQDVMRKRPVMIFCNSTESSSRLAEFLNEVQVDCAVFNSSLSDEERLQEFKRFVRGEVNVMSCTDVASRGHDIPTVKHIINYEFPMCMADYVHRCGRTGRIGGEEDCTVTSLISSKAELPLLQKIEIAARMGEELPNVNNNIKRIIHHKIQRRMNS